jgi:hypothetical protein
MIPNLFFSTATNYHIYFDYLATGWHLGMDKPEVLAKGRRQGATRTKAGEFPSSSW